jgi:hypothetical protein
MSASHPLHPRIPRHAAQAPEEELDRAHHVAAALRPHATQLPAAILTHEQAVLHAPPLTPEHKTCAKKKLVLQESSSFHLSSVIYKDH